MPTSDDVINYWFNELQPKHWWVKDSRIDQQITERFGELHTQAAVGELYAWRGTAQGRLAEVVVLDQFSRNIYRDDPRAFATDSVVLVLAQEAVRLEADKAVNESWRQFFYLPFMHSESLAIQDVSIQLYERLAEDVGGDAHNNLEFAHKHRVIIERFGRYPHRNEILGRESTAEELEFLKQPGSGF